VYVGILLHDCMTCYFDLTYYIKADWDYDRVCDVRIVVLSDALLYCLQPLYSQRFSANAYIAHYTLHFLLLRYI